MQNNYEDQIIILKERDTWNSQLDFLVGKVYLALKQNNSSTTYNKRMIGIRSNGMFVYFRQIFNNITHISAVNQIPKAGVYICQTTNSFKLFEQFIELNLTFLEGQLFHFDKIDLNGLIKHPKSKKIIHWKFQIDINLYKEYINTLKPKLQEHIIQQKLEQQNEIQFSNSIKIDNELCINQHKKSDEIPNIEISICQNNKIIESQFINSENYLQSIDGKSSKLLLQSPQSQLRQSQQLHESIDLQNNKNKYTNSSDQILKSEKNNIIKQTNDSLQNEKKSLLNNYFNYRYLCIIEQICNQKNQSEIIKHELELFNLIGEFSEFCQTICSNLDVQNQGIHYKNNVKIIVENTKRLNTSIRNDSFLSDVLLQLRRTTNSPILVPLSCLVYYKRFKYLCIADFTPKETYLLKYNIYLNSLCQVLNLIIDNGQQVISLNYDALLDVKQKLNDDNIISSDLVFLKDTNCMFPINLRPEIVVEHCPVRLQKSTDQYDQDHVLTERMLHEEIIYRFVSDLHNLIILPIDSKGISEMFHHYGINIRLLGKITQISLALHIKQLFICEMIARVSKYIVKQEIEISYEHSVEDYLQLILGKGIENEIFWNSVLQQEVMNKFDYDIGQYPSFVPQGTLLNHLLYHFNCSIKMSSQLLQNFEVHSLTFKSKFKNFKFPSTTISKSAYSSDSKSNIGIRILINKALKQPIKVQEHCKGADETQLIELLTSNEEYLYFPQYISVLSQLLLITQDFQYFDLALKNIDFCFGQYHPLQASIYLISSDIYKNKKQLQDSLILIQAALNILNKCFGKIHPLIGDILQEIGQIHEKINDLTKAKQYYNEALIHYKDLQAKQEIKKKIEKL